MSSLYRKSGIFYYQGKDEDGSRIKQSLHTGDRAEAKEKKAKLDERFSTDPPSTLSKLVEDYLEHRRRTRDKGVRRFRFCSLGILRRFEASRAGHFPFLNLSEP